MRTVPEYILKEIQPGNEIIWWDRRAFFEVIAELAESIYWSWTVITLASLAYWYWQFNAWWFWIGVTYWLAMAARKGFMEYKRWQYELHVVTYDKPNGDGMYYLFEGWLDQNPARERITLSSPTIIGPKRPFVYRVWGWFTGEQMAWMGLVGPSGVHLNQKRISPQLSYAINTVRGGKKDPNYTPETTPRLHDAGLLHQLAMSSLMTKNDKQEFKTMILSIAREVVWPSC